MKQFIKASLFSVFLMSSVNAVADTEEDIRSALNYYAEAWNEGDLELIRSYYHPGFVLISQNGLMTLSQRLDDIKTVMRPGEDHGELSHSGLVIEAIEKEHALAYGHVKLQFKDGTQLDAWFSTIYVKTPFGWKAQLTHN